MPRKVTYVQALVAHGWVALDPLDGEIIERLFKKDIREGEEKLMLAVLESAVEDFQKYVLARKPRGKKLFQEAEEWFLERNSDELFSFENICDTLLNSRDAEPHPASRAKLARTRIADTSIRFSQTA